MPTETSLIDQVALEPLQPIRLGRATRSAQIKGRNLPPLEAPFFFEREALLPVAEAHAGEFASAAPFPNLAIDGLVPAEVLRQVLGEVPAADDERWFSRENPKSHAKQEIQNDWELGPTTRHLLDQFNSAVVVEFLERLSGIEGLIPDPHHDGGGLQQIGAGGFLKIHTDVPFHRAWKLDRQINVLLYLNEDWDESWGGEFELWTDDMSSHETVAPLFNRMMIFATRGAKHGHPDPLRCPEGSFRRALVLHYYTAAALECEGPRNPERHYARPGEVLDPMKRASRPRAVAKKSRAREFLPPVLYRGGQKVRRLISA